MVARDVYIDIRDLLKKEGGSTGAAGLGHLLGGSSRGEGALETQQASSHEVVLWLVAKGEGAQQCVASG